jgi:hypothetical protein
MTSTTVRRDVPLHQWSGYMCEWLSRQRVKSIALDVGNPMMASFQWRALLFANVRGRIFAGLQRDDPDYTMETTGTTILDTFHLLKDYFTRTKNVYVRTDRDNVYRLDERAPMIISVCLHSVPYRPLLAYTASNRSVGFSGTAIDESLLDLTEITRIEEPFDRYLQPVASERAFKKRAIDTLARAFPANPQETFEQLAFARERAEIREEEEEEETEEGMKTRFSLSDIERILKNAALRSADQGKVLILVKGGGLRAIELNNTLDEREEEEEEQ